MPPLPRITGREVVRALGKLAWVVVVQKGSMRSSSGQTGAVV
jgi:predicted RNA binding protein YcfA (HicA-like mRNA interferase family)